MYLEVTGRASETVFSVIIFGLISLLRHVEYQLINYENERNQKKIFKLF